MSLLDHRERSPAQDLKANLLGWGVFLCCPFVPNSHAGGGGLCPERPEGKRNNKEKVP